MLMDSEFFHQTSHSVLLNLHQHPPQRQRQLNISLSTAWLHIWGSKPCAPSSSKIAGKWKFNPPKQKQKGFMALTHPHICFSLLSSRCARGGILRSRSRTKLGRKSPSCSQRSKHRGGNVEVKWQITLPLWRFTYNTLKHPWITAILFEWQKTQLEGPIPAWSLNLTCRFSHLRKKHRAHIQNRQQNAHT